MIHSFLHSNFQKKLCIALTLGIYFFLPGLTHAATLSMVPSTSSITVGNIVSVKAVVNTSGVAINNSEATIQFPTDLLEVVSVSKSSSIFSLWVEEPHFSNSIGTITFNGGISNPGYTGSSGSITTVTFRAKKQGTASIIFSDAAVRANDGLGTNVLTSKNSSTIVITTAPKEVKTPTPTTTSPEKIVEVPVSIVFTATSRIDNNQNIIIFNTTGSTSKISYYTIQVDSDPLITVKSAEVVKNEYTLPILNPGAHGIIITAYDTTAHHGEYALNIVSPFISVPRITLNSHEITKGDSIVVSGMSDYPNKQVLVTVESGGKELKTYLQKISSDGSFTITTDSIETTGLVHISAVNILSDRVKSQASEKLYLKVIQTQFIKTSMIILWLILILILLLILLFVAYLGWHKFFRLRDRLNKDLEKTKGEIHDATVLLKDELREHLKMLEKIKEDRALNKKEEAIFSEIEKNMDDLERFIARKLKK